MLRLIFSEKHGSNKGFTLIEMMVVVAIIAVLAAVAIPKFMKSMDAAKSIEAVTNMGRIADALNSYYAQYGIFPTTPNDMTAGVTGSGDISADLPTVDLSGSVNWAYKVKTSSSSNQFCITATAVTVSSFANNKSIYYVNDVSGLDNATHKPLFEGNFYKGDLFAGSAGVATAPAGTVNTYVTSADCL